MRATTVTTSSRATAPATRAPLAARPPLGTMIRKGFSTLLVVLAFCALAVAGYEVTTGQWHATPVLSGSMRPAMQPGDVVVTQRVPISALRVRDVVVFYPPNQTSHQTVHRIVKLTVKGTTTSITTWGDANLVSDPAVSSLKGDTAYRMVRVLPLIGYPAIWLQNAGRGLLAIALGTILLIAAAVTILRPDKPAKPTDPADPDDPDERSDELSPRDERAGQTQAH
jgi:signal peptidase I